MGVESYLVLWVFTDECCHPNRFGVELMLIEVSRSEDSTSLIVILSNLLIVLLPTFDMRGRPQVAKPACGRPSMEGLGFGFVANHFDVVPVRTK